MATDVISIPRNAWVAALCCVVGLAAARPASADTLVLKSGRTIQAQVERYTDGAFWVRAGRQTAVFYPEDIEKIVFDPVRAVKPSTPAGVRAAGPPEADGLGEADPDSAIGAEPAGRLSKTADALSGIPAADAAGDDAAAESDADTGLAIVNYQAMMTRGIFQIVGDVENRTEVPARYVKVTVTLFDGRGEAIGRNFSYLLGKDPNLAPGDRKGFRVSFLNPPDGVTKYKIRVESSQF
ncbi:DUF3426 domain-containing protein [bacterium]|nr:DUF3426 domain-containing protein [bacterium]